MDAFILAASLSSSCYHARGVLCILGLLFMGLAMMWKECREKDGVARRQCHAEDIAEYTPTTAPEMIMIADSAS